MFDIFVRAIKPYINAMNVTREFWHVSAIPYVQTSEFLDTKYNSKFFFHFRGLTPPEFMTELLIHFRGLTPPEFMNELLIHFRGLHTTGIPLGWPICFNIFVGCSPLEYHLDDQHCLSCIVLKGIFVRIKQNNDTINTYLSSDDIS